jgi:D-alanyl-D-alanine carboxypeptidase
MPSGIHVAAACAGARLRVVISLALLSLLAGCGSHYRSSSYHHGSQYSGPSRYYPPPGPSNDPWGPYIHQAGVQYSVPDQWIRAVMRQESGGREQVVSSAGAMGLMQIMPDTYDYLRGRYGLGDDPFEPHDNIMAGTAYIRELYDRFGSPGFLAAYNAGPGRLNSYLAGGGSLPSETVNYVAAIAPRLGNSVAMTGPLAVYGGGSVQYASLPVASQSTGFATGSGCDPDAAYDPSRPCAPIAPSAPGYAPVATSGYAPIAVAQAAAAPSSGGCDPDAAYDPSRPCAPAPAVQLASTAPAAVTSQSLVYRPAAYSAPPSTFPAGPPPVAPQASVASGGWAIQVGAFSAEWRARLAADGARDASPELLRSAQVELMPTTPFGGQIIYRARLGNLASGTASAACARLVAQQMPCIVVPPGQAS